METEVLWLINHRINWTGIIYFIAVLLNIAK